jgi:hypothetical protein
LVTLVKASQNAEACWRLELVEFHKANKIKAEACWRLELVEFHKASKASKAGKGW